MEPKDMLRHHITDLKEDVPRTLKEISRGFIEAGSGLTIILGVGTRLSFYKVLFPVVRNFPIISLILSGSIIGYNYFLDENEQNKIKDSIAQLIDSNRESIWEACGDSCDAGNWHEGVNYNFCFSEKEYLRDIADDCITYKDINDIQEMCPKKIYSGEVIVFITDETKENVTECVREKAPQK